MGRNEKPVRGLFEENFEEIARIEPKDWPAVGGDVAQSGQGGVDLSNRLEIRDIEQVVHLADLTAPLVDGADLGTENETDGLGQDGGLNAWWQQRSHIMAGISFQAEKTGFGGFKAVMEMGKPAGMGEIAGPHHRNALDRGPGGQTVQVARLAGGPGKVAMNMEIGNVLHKDARQP